MNNPKLAQLPTYMKLFASSLLFIIGLMYIVLLVNIHVDTEFKPSFIIEAYGEMEYIELSAIVHDALPYYALLIFAIPVLLFMFTSYSDKIKRLCAIVPFMLILVDVGSMYLIPYVNKVFFSYTLWIAGLCLAITFLMLFISILYDMWLQKQV